MKMISKGNPGSLMLSSEQAELRSEAADAVDKYKEFYLTLLHNDTEPLITHSFQVKSICKQKCAVKICSLPFAVNASSDCI